MTFVRNTQLEWMTELEIKVILQYEVINFFIYYQNYWDPQFERLLYNT